METSIHLASVHTPSTSPTASRLSQDATSILAPSPNLKEPGLSTKDDQALLSLSPRTPKRPDYLARGLSLQMPPKSMSMPVTTSTSNRIPLSPQLDPMTSCASPATSLPRHSRGLDFSRACTNLHHSTLAESSPNSSPTITQKSMVIPSRKGSVSSMMLDSPNLGPSMTWPSLHNMDRSTVSSSVGSVNMLASESGDSDNSDDEAIDLDDAEDSIYTTPQIHKISNPNAYTPYGPASASAGVWSNSFSPATASLMKNFQRTRLHKGRSRKSSSSASGQSAMPSPRTTSPPPVRSTESGNGFFGWPKIPSSRRESLALGTDQLQLSSGNDSGDEASAPAPHTPGVIRRPVTRRGNLLVSLVHWIRVICRMLISCSRKRKALPVSGPVSYTHLTLPTKRIV